MKVAVIGAGIAGIACARFMHRRGHEVHLFEKSRGFGGRMSTRWVDEASPRAGFDHGAQYFSAEHPDFLKVLNKAAAAGAVQAWDGTVVELSYGQVVPRQSPSKRWVGVPGMTSLGRFLAQDLSAHLQTRVEKIRRVEGVWALDAVTTGGHAQHLHGWDAVVVAVPCEQAAVLLEPSPAFADCARSVVSSPNWTVMVEFEDPVVTHFDAAFVHDSPLGWIARDSSKPGRSDSADRWVLQATSVWSEAHLDHDAGVVAKQLSDVFLSTVGSRVVPRTLTAHRWRYSVPIQPLGQDFLFDESLRLGVVGDWLKGPRVEDAYLSGLSLGKRLNLWMPSSNAGEQNTLSA